MSVTAARNLGSETITEGIRVRVEPSFNPAHSDAERGRFTFVYHITMTNEGSLAATLCGRQWVIVDAEGARSLVVGPDVVGKTPHLAPGQSFEYSSYCMLPTRWGTMEGHFTFEREDGSTFNALVSRFYLASAS